MAYPQNLKEQFTPQGTRYVVPEETGLGKVFEGILKETSDLVISLDPDLEDCWKYREAIGHMGIKKNISPKYCTGEFGFTFIYYDDSMNEEFWEQREVAVHRETGEILPLDHESFMKRPIQYASVRLSVLKQIAKQKESNDHFCVFISRGQYAAEEIDSLVKDVFSDEGRPNPTKER